MIRDDGIRYLVIELIQRLGRLDPREGVQNIDEIIEALAQRKEKIERSFENA